jgi:hypothetical protein
VQGLRHLGTVALDVKVILIPPRLCISSVVLHTKYTGARENDFNVRAQVLSVGHRSSLIPLHDAVLTIQAGVLGPLSPPA